MRRFGWKLGDEPLRDPTIGIADCCTRAARGQ
jgi:hypothetical protein